MQIFIHKDFFHLPFHLRLVEKEGKAMLIKTENVFNNENAVVLGTPEYEAFRKLHLLPEIEFPPENVLKSYRGVLRTTGVQSVPWSFCMPQGAFLEIIKAVGDQLLSSTKDLDFGYYERFYSMGQKVLKKLKPSFIDKEFYETISDFPNVSSFCPDENGFAETPIYSRVDTVSGRTKIISGANILNLKKEHRKLIKSRFGENGSVFYLDFSSLEPRLALVTSKLLKKEEALHYELMEPNQAMKEQETSGSIQKDLYSDLLNGVNLSGGSAFGITRDEIKLVTISELYGAGIAALSEQLPRLSKGNLEFLIANVKEYFQLDFLKESLMKQYEKNDKFFIKNFYGRYVSTADVGSYALLNRFIQSSAVDVALIGFSGIVDYVEDMGWQDEILPLFVLHDGMFLDIKKNRFNVVPTLCKIGSIDLPNLENYNFYIKSEQII